MSLNHVIFLSTLASVYSLSAPTTRGIRMCTNNETIAVQVVTRPGAKNAIGCQCQANTQQDSSFRDDYVYTPGIGSHKIYTDAKSWNDARKACLQDDAHLAIINSKAEEEVLTDMLKRAEKKIRFALNTEEVLIGTHDLYTEGDWVTIFGEPLEKTGYARWSKTYFGGQPDNNGGIQNCGALISVQDGGMDDVYCLDKFAYACELPISC